MGKYNTLHFGLIFSWRFFGLWSGCSLKNAGIKSRKEVKLNCELKKTVSATILDFKIKDKITETTEI